MNVGDRFSCMLEWYFIESALNDGEFLMDIWNLNKSVNSDYWSCAAKYSLFDYKMWISGWGYKLVGLSGTKNE